MLQFCNVVKKYGDAMILKNVEATFEKASFHFICGKSGSGKSTLLKLIDRELEPDEGEILWRGKELQHFNRCSKPFC